MWARLSSEAKDAMDEHDKGSPAAPGFNKTAPAHYAKDAITMASAHTGRSGSGTHTGRNLSGGGGLQKQNHLFSSRGFENENMNASRVSGSGGGSGGGGGGGGGRDASPASYYRPSMSQMSAMSGGASGRSRATTAVPSLNLAKASPKEKVCVMCVIGYVYVL